MSNDQQSIVNVQDGNERPVQDKGIKTLSVAVFGQRHAGKTSLLASYYGTLQSATFRKEHRYDITTTRASQGAQLLSKYYRMEKGNFPEPTGRYEKYEFGFYPEGMQGNRVDPVLELHWTDYPGEWWQTDAEKDEKEARIRILRALLMSHAAILLVDGEKYKEYGAAYAKRLFGEFRHEVRRIKRALHEVEGASDGFPKDWILALSKSDVFGQSYTAKDFFRSISEDANDEIAGLAKELGPRNFARQYILLSAAAKANGTADVTRTKGLEAIAPAVLLEAMAHVADDFEVPKQDLKGYLKHLAYELVKNVDKLDDRLPAKWQVITMLIKSTQLREILGSEVAELDRKRGKYLKNKKYLEAVVAALEGDRHRSEAKNHWYMIQDAR